MGAAGWMATIAGAIALAGTVYAVPAAICRVMNRGIGPLTPASLVNAIVLLSGRVWIQSDREGRTSGILSQTCAARVREAARVYELARPEWIVSAGGLPDPASGVPTCAELMRDTLIGLGVPADRILVEKASRTTRDEALLVGKMLAERHVTGPVALVTSDVHMRRSLGAFRATSVQCVPAMAPDPDGSRGWSAWVLPSAHGVRFSTDVAHELLGLVWYRTRGWLTRGENGVRGGNG